MPFTHKFLLFLSVLLLGCFGGTIPHDPEGMAGGRAFLNSLVGKPSEVVVREFGIPDELQFDGQSLYMLYTERGSGTSVLTIGWIPVWGVKDDDVKHCLRIELDNDDLVKAYAIKSKSTGGGWVVFMPVGYGPFICRDLFWTEQEQENLVSESTRKPTWQKEVLQRLCKSADQGNQETMYKLGEIYEWGEVEFIEQNYIRAYVWYSLSGATDEDIKSFVDSYFSPSDLQQAEQALKDWEPGQCRRELGFSE